MESSKFHPSKESAEPAIGAKRRRRRGVRGELLSGAVGVNLAASDLADIEARALAMGLSRAAWIRALVRRHIQGQPTFSLAGEQTLIAIVTELRRIGVDIRQTLLEMQTAIEGGESLDRELASLADLRAEIRGQMQAVGEAFEGNLALWETPR